MFEKIKEYINTNIELQKLSAVEKMALIIGAFSASVIVLIFCLLAMAFLSIGLCLYISALLGDTYSGFLIVGAVYVILAVITYQVKDKLIVKPIVDGFIRMIFKKIL
jgi:hypothetical protein